MVESIKIIYLFYRITTKRLFIRFNYDEIFLFTIILFYKF